MSGKLIIPQEAIVSKIYLVRDQRVMLDRDLSKLYGVKAIRLREQVKRNAERFPNNFMFQLSEEEAKSMVSQNAIPSKQHLGGTLPYVFTEHGVLQLANVLRSGSAVQMSIRIIEVFVKMREIILTHKDMLIKMNALEVKVGNQDKSIKQIFSYIKQLIKEQDKPEPPRKSIGFKTKKK